MSKLARLNAFILGAVLIGWGLLKICMLTPWYVINPLSFDLNLMHPRVVVLYVCNALLIGGVLITAAWKKYQGGVPFYIGVLLLFIGLTDFADIVRLYAFGIQNDFPIARWFVMGLGNIAAGGILLWHGHRRHRKLQTFSSRPYAW